MSAIHSAHPEGESSRRKARLTAVGEYGVTYGAAALGLQGYLLLLDVQSWTLATAVSTIELDSSDISEERHVRTAELGRLYDSSEEDNR